MQTSRLAISERIMNNRDPSRQVSDMVGLCNEKLQAIRGTCPKDKALKILSNYASSLELNEADTADVFCAIKRRDLQFELPVTFMHGDLSIGNSGYDTKTRLFDWEWACPDGSVLYDWWYLNNWVSWKVSSGHLDGSLSQPVEKFVIAAIRTLG